MLKFINKIYESLSAMLKVKQKFSNFYILYERHTNEDIKINRYISVKIKIIC